jgi:PleD family two-component response regulator
MLVTRSRASPSPREKGASLARPVILIVDDDDLFCLRVRGLAVAAGFDVRTAKDGHQALELLLACATSIVVVDVGMAGMGGLELCRRIRAHEWPQYLYVILLSHREDESYSLAAFAV